MNGSVQCNCCYMYVSVHDFVWVDAYSDFGYNTLDNIPFSLFQNGRELDNFPRDKNKYTWRENIMKFVDRAYKRGGGWERKWSTNVLVFFIGNITIVLIEQHQ